MKLENEPRFGAQTPPRKSYNPFDSDDEETNGFKKSIVNGYDIKTFEKSADSITFHLDNGDLSWEEAILGHTSIFNHTTPVENANGEEVPSRKDTELFTDITVMDCELPELMVCYKDNTYHSVKDIGIDEGVPVHDKVWIQSQENHGSENFYAFSALNGVTSSNLILRDEQRGPPFLEGDNSSSDKDLEKDASVQNGTGLDHKALERQHSANKCGSDDSTEVDKFKDDSGEKESSSGCKTTEDPSKTSGVVHVTRDSQLSERDEVNYDKVEKNGNDISGQEHGREKVSTESTDESSTRSPIVNATKSSESQSEEATSPEASELVASQESAGSDVANVLSYSSKVESGSIILDFNYSSSSSLSRKVEEAKSQKTDAVDEKPPETQTMSRHDEGARGSNAVASMDKQVNGETSYSAGLPLPSSITLKGPITCSGSISLRSESSTGSTRSFAFPVLQAEWNSSPVRMAKSDKKHFRKHRGWIHSLVCCRF